MELQSAQLAGVVAGFGPFRKLQDEPPSNRKPLWAEAFEANGISYPKEWLGRRIGVDW